MGDSSENSYGRDADLVLIAVFKYAHKHQMLGVFKLLVFHLSSFMTELENVYVLLTMPDLNVFVTRWVKCNTVFQHWF